MKKLRKVMKVSLTALLLLSSAGQAFALPAGAVETAHTTAGAAGTNGHWAAASINKWVGNGVIQGYEGGDFKPNRSITRAEFVTVLNRLFGFTATGSGGFSDVPAKAWYASQLEIARTAGYYEGYPNNQAKAESEITRQDAVTLLARLFQMDAPADRPAARFSDSADISSYATDAVYALSGIVNGYENGAFVPKGAITRAETVALLDRLVGGYYAKAGETAGGTVNGNAMIARPGVVLKDTVINGNLYLSAGIRDGEAVLDGVIVKGKTFIEGGGTTVRLKNSTLGETVIQRKNGRVNMTAEGTARVAGLTVNSEARLELSGTAVIDAVRLNRQTAVDLAEGTAIRSLTINEAAAGSAITGKGKIDSVTNKGTGVTLNGTSLALGLFAIAGGVAAAPGTAAGQGAGNPGTSSPGTGTPGTGSPGTGSPGTGNPGTEQPGTGNPGTGNPGTEQPGTGNPGTGNPGTGNPGTEQPGTGEPRTIDLADADATAETRSLFAYLQDIRGKHTLFGHQHATDEALSEPVNGIKSDTYAAVGDLPAMFGWDTLSLEGFEKPGSTENTPEQNRDNLAASMKAAYEEGGVLALSAHMPNFVTGNDFYDTKGNVVSHILPGGDKHADYNAFLDRIADFALHLKDGEGRLIPVIFRPFHEQNGGWFWWGAPYTTKEQYAEIYRYTVEYLRDIKGVHNFLYAFSPGSPFNGNEETFLKTYPGDDYVDILGFDTYYDGSNHGWFETVVDDARLISRLADRKGKVAAFTEFGYSNVKPTGTADLKFYTKLIQAMQSDPDAKRMAYMLTWANFNYNSIFVPYRNSLEQERNGNPKDHELLPDFVDYYNDPYTSFSGELEGVYDKKVTTAEERPFMHIVSPTGQETVRTAVTTIRARVLNAQPAKVVYSVQGSAEEHPMTLDSQGFYSAQWAPEAEQNGKGTELTVKAYAPDGTVLQQTISVYMEIPEIVLTKLTFDHDIEGVQNNGAYPDSITSSFSHTTVEGDGKLAIGVTGLTYTDTWQELKIGLPGIGEQVGLKQVNRVAYDVLVPLSAGAKEENATLRVAVELPPGYDKFGADKAVKLTELEQVTVSGAVYGKFTASIDLTDEEQIQAASGLSIAVIGSGLEYAGPIYLDNLRLINAYIGGNTDPALVDDFEGYKGSSELLRTGYSPNGDHNEISLDPAHAANGDYALKLDYTLAGQGYTGITKSLNGLDWSKTGRLKFWLVPDGQNKKLVIQVKANDISFEYYPSLADTQPRWVEVPFKDFTTAAWDTSHTGKKLDTVNAANIQAFSIYVNAPDGESYTKNDPFKGTLYFDQIHVIPGEPGDIPDGTGGGEQPGGGIQEGTLFGFETGTQNWAIGENTAGASAPAVTADAAAEGSHSLQTVFRLEPAGTNFLLGTAGLNLTGAASVTAKVKLSSGTAKVSLYIQTGSGWTWTEGGTVEADSSGFVPVSLPLSSVSHLGDVKGLGIKVEPVSGSGSATLYLDDVAITK